MVALFMATIRNFRPLIESLGASAHRLQSSSEMSDRCGQISGREAAV
jgi:hypothetical protein